MRTYAKKEWFALAVIPVEFMIVNGLGVIPQLRENPLLITIFTTATFMIGFLVLIGLFKSFLSQQWQQFKQERFVLKLLLSVALSIGASAVLMASRGVMNTLLFAGGISLSNQKEQVLLMLLSMIPPLLAPFAEEIVFRYLLFWKMKKTGVKFLMGIVSSVLFGLIHVFNFNGDIAQTVPYMIVGSYFCLIYVFTKNIWGSLMTHWIFNASNTLLPAILMLFIQ